MICDQPYHTANIALRQPNFNDSIYRAPMAVGFSGKKTGRAGEKGAVGHGIDGQTERTRRLPIASMGAWFRKIGC